MRSDGSWSMSSASGLPSNGLIRLRGVRSPAGLRLTVGAADLIQNRLAVLEETLVLRYFFCNRVLLLVTYENPRIHTFPAGLLRAQSKPTFRRCAGSP